jgi:hypothetical protein
MADAAYLLFAGLCDPRCLLAMNTPPGDTSSCTCVCGGRYHAALVFHDVMPQPWFCPECGGAPEDCVRFRDAWLARIEAEGDPGFTTGGKCCPDCGHTAEAIATARQWLEANATTPNTAPPGDPSAAAAPTPEETATPWPASERSSRVSSPPKPSEASTTATPG